MSLVLYYAPVTCALAPYITLTEAGADFDVRPINLRKGEQRSPEYLKLNPKHQVPTLVIDGEPLTENPAIQVWIARNFPKERLLRSAGYQAAGAPDYIDALKMLDEGQGFDLLLTDVVMPNRVHGFALARMARLRHRGLKVLYITGHDVPEWDADGKILRKPIDDDQLIREVSSALAA